MMSAVSCASSAVTVPGCSSPPEQAATNRAGAIRPTRRIPVLILQLGASLFERAAGGVGGAIGLPLTGLVAEQASWRWLFAGAAVLGALLVVAVMRWVDESPVRAGGRFDLPGAVGLVDSGRRCEHLVLTPPFLWPDLQVVDETGGPDGTGPLLTRLQAVPITSAEMSAVARDGADALFELLDAADADVTNPDRPSVV